MLHTPSSLRKSLTVSISKCLIPFRNVYNLLRQTKLCLAASSMGAVSTYLRSNVIIDCIKGKGILNNPREQSLIDKKMPVGLFSTCLNLKCAASDRTSLL